MSESETTTGYTRPANSQSQPAEQETPTRSAPDTSSDKSDAVKAAQGDALTPDQKHRNYLDDIERLHNEP